jgi:hypothetical protein
MPEEKTGYSRNPDFGEVTTDVQNDVERPDSASDIQTAIDDLASANGGIVRPRVGTYTVSSTLQVKPGVVLDLTDNVELRPSGDFNVIECQVGSNEIGQVRGGYIQTAQVTFTSDVIFVDVGDNNGLTPAQSSTASELIAKNVRAKGSTGTGTGTFLHIRTAGTDNAFYTGAIDCKTRGYEAVLNLESDQSSGSGSINANRFHGFQCFKPVRAVDINILNGGVIDGNRFSDWLVNVDTATVDKMFYWDGNRNGYSGTVFDAGAATIHDVQPTADGTELDITVEPDANVSDAGTNTTIIETHQSANAQPRISGFEIEDAAGKLHRGKLADAFSGFNWQSGLSTTTGGGSVTFLYDKIQLREPGNASARSESRVYNANVGFDPADPGSIRLEVSNVVIDDTSDARILLMVTDNPDADREGSGDDYLATRIRGDGALRAVTSDDGTSGGTGSTFISNSEIDNLNYIKMSWDGSSVSVEISDGSTVYDETDSSNYPSGENLHLKVAALDENSSGATNIDFDVDQITLT